MPRPAELILAVAVGSAAGGVTRYLLTGAVELRVATGFPVGTFVVNLVGCFILGVIAHVVLVNHDLSPAARLVLTTGFCGGFTTFSTFSLESLELIQNGQVGRAAAYIGASVGLGILGVWLGMAAGRGLTPTP